MLQKNLKRKNVYVKPNQPSLVANTKEKKPLPPLPKIGISRANQHSSGGVSMERDSQFPVRKPKTYKVTSSIQDLQALEAIVPEKKVEKIVNIQSARLAIQMAKFEASLIKKEGLKEAANISNDEVTTYLKNSLDADAHLKSLHTKLNLSKTTKESELYLSKLASQKLHLEALRRDREQTRKMILLAQAKAAQVAEEKAIEDVMLNNLLRQSKQERRIAEQLMSVRNEKEIIQQNRVYRDQQYAIAREKEYQEALEKEFRLYAEAKKGFRENLGMVMEQHFEILKQVRDNEHAQDKEWIQKKIVLPLVDLAMKVHDYKVLNGKDEVPFKKMREWKTILANEMSVINHVEPPLEKNYIPPIPGDVVARDDVKEALVAPSQEIPPSVLLLDTEEFNDYIHFKGAWESTKSDEFIENNVKLGAILEELMNAANQPEKNVAVAPIASTPLRLILLGKKFSGKHTLAGFIAENYSMTIIQIDELIKDSIAVADITFSRKKDKNDKDVKKLTKPQIGAMLQHAMTDGQSPDDSLLVQLVTDAMSMEPAPEKRGGWLILDFPQTRNQAMLLEKEISGYEDPKPAKKGDLRRKDKETPSKSRSRSLVTAFDLKMSTSTPASGIDLVLFLDVPSEVAIYRAAGQYVDPETGTSFHIETNPPSLERPGLMESVVAMENTAVQLQYQIAAFEAQEIVLRDWFQQFKILNVMDANQAPEKIKTSVQNLLNELIDFINLASIAEDKSLVPASGEGVTGFKPRHSTAFWGRSSACPGVAVAEISMDSLIPESKEASANLKALPLKKFPTKEFAEILSNQWVNLETAYTENLKFSFRAIRRLRDDALLYLYDSKSHFYKFLQRPDVAQDLLDTFQREYNAVEEDFRADSDVKAELHLRVEELLDKLWDVADKRRDESETERLAIIEDRWIEDQSYVLANLTITMMQAEADRFLLTRQFIIDYFKDMHGLVLPEVVKPKLKIPFVAPNEAPPIEVGSALIAISEHTSQKRKDEHHRPEKVEVSEHAKKSKSEKTKEKKGTKYSSSDKQAMQAIGEMQKLDPDSIKFPEITYNIELVLNLTTGEHSAAVLRQTVETKKATSAGKFDDNNNRYR